MADKAVENARRQREEFAERINRAQQELDECRSAIARVDQFLSDYEAFAAGNFSDIVQHSSVATPAKAPIRRNSPKEAVSKQARIFISEAGAPIPRDKLYEMLMDAGLTIEGTDPEGVMNTMLWRTRDDIGVIHLKNTGYWLKERPWPLAGYDADLDDIIGVEDDAPSDDLDSSVA